MNEFLIINYLNNLDKNYLNNLALQNNIILSIEELDYVYKTLKKDYKKLLSNEYEEIFNNSKNFLSNENQQKIYNLYLKYRNIYKNFFDL